MKQFYERFESTLKQALRSPGGRRWPEAVGRRRCRARGHAGALRARLPAPVTAKSGFTKKPTESLAAQRRYVAA